MAYLCGAMFLTAPHIKHLLKKKLATLMLVSASIACFATLGDGGKKSAKPKGLLTTKSDHYNYRHFSLKSGYQYRGSQPFSLPQQNSFIMLNTVVTYQKGNATYILPMKKKVLLDKVSFKPIAR